MFRSYGKKCVLWVCFSLFDIFSSSVAYPGHGETCPKIFTENNPYDDVSKKIISKSATPLKFFSTDDFVQKKQIKNNNFLQSNAHNTINRRLIVILFLYLIIYLFKL